MTDSFLSKKICFIVFSGLFLFAVFFVLSCANIYGLVYPFAFGFLFALIWCGQKLWIVVPVFVLAGMAHLPSFDNFSATIICLVLMLLFVGLHTKLKKPIKLPVYVFYCLLSQIGVLIFNFRGAILEGVISVFLAVVFFVAIKGAAELVFLKKVSYKINVLEAVGGLLFLCAVSSGLSELSFWGFSLLKFFACLVILVTQTLLPLSVGMLVAGVLGVGELLTSGASVFLMPFVLWVLVFGVLINFNKLLACLGVVLMEVFMGFVLSLYPGFSLSGMLPVVLAVVIYLVIPKNFLQEKKDMFFVSASTMAKANVVNRSRESLCKRLTNLSEVFGEMDYIFRDMVKNGLTPDELRKVLVSEIQDLVCADCKDKNFCHRECASDTSSVFGGLVDKALSRGKSSLLDIPPFLSLRCGRVSSVVNVVNDLCLKHKNQQNISSSFNEGRMLVAEELRGISKIIKELALEVNKNIAFDGSREEEILKKLSFNNILCLDVVVYEQNQNVISATVVVKKSDTEKSIIPQIISRVCSNKMVLTDVVSASRPGWNVLTLHTAPKFDIVFGTASLMKDGSAVSGDCYSVIKIASDKFLLAVCDGMGSGEQAKRASSLAIGLVENFYKAGFDNEIILSSINKLLTLNKEEIFSALDICVINTRQGSADFIKLGAPASYIKNPNVSTKKISGGALPLGIVQSIKPVIKKEILGLGDFVFLFTDGIPDSFGSEEILQDFVNNLTSLNPQVLAEEIVKEAVTRRGGAIDDLTVIVAKIFEL